MELIKATQDDFRVVKNIVHNTIKDIYPNYYPKGAVEFFLSHHSDENIKNAIEEKEIYLLLEKNNFIGTGSIKENEICRLFVLPEYQGKGYGTKIMDALEEILFESFNEIKLAASFPAYDMYIKRGYAPSVYNKILTEKGHYLCYHEMIYICNKEKQPI